MTDVTASVEGHCDPAFAAVGDAFRENFAERGEIGAALCVMMGGRVVVDLWGGWADRDQRRPWRPDTLVNLFSVGKGLIAACAARLAGQGLLDPDAAVTAYWPEFAAEAKETITVRQLLSHQAGLPALSKPMPEDAMFDWDLMTTELAAQRPWWQPGSGHGYHVNTFGYLAGEVIRRVTCLTPGALLREQVAGPLRADVHIGLPSELHGRVATFEWPDRAAPALTPDPGQPPVREQIMTRNAYFNPPGLSGFGVINSPRWRSAEIPSANAHGTARGVARVYAALTAGGSLDGTTIVDRAALTDAVAEHASGHDLVLGRPSRFGLGFQLTQPGRPLPGGPWAFGHFGAGGSLGCCDPDTGLAFGYTMNLMGPRWQNPRTRALADAVATCL